MNEPIDRDTEPGPFAGPPTLDRLAMEIRSHRKDFRRLTEDLAARWRRVDEDERLLDRFFDEWYGDPEHDRPGLVHKVRLMVDEWAKLKWGGRIVIAVMTTIASGVGYLVATLIQHIFVQH